MRICHSARTCSSLLAALLLAALSLGGCEPSIPSHTLSTGALEEAAEVQLPEPSPLLQPLNATSAEGSYRAHASSPLALALFAGRRVALLADADDQRLRLLALDTGEQLAERTLDASPAHVLLDPRGDIHVALRDTSEVVTLELACREEAHARAGDTERNKAANDTGDDTRNAKQDASCIPELVERTRITTPEEPIALGLAHAGATLLVSCGWGHALMAHPLDERGRRFVTPLAQEPRGFAVEQDGAHAVIAHALGSRISRVSLSDGEVTAERALSWRDDVLDPPSGNTVAQLPRHLVQGFSVALLGERALLPMVAAYPGDALTDAAGYGASVLEIEPFFPHEQVVIETSLSEDAPSWLRLASEVVNADDKRRSSGRPVKPPLSPCLLPRAIAPTPAGDGVLVACFDSGEVVELSAERLPLARAERRRFAVGAGAEAIAIDALAEQAWVWSSLDRQLSRLALAQDETAPAQTIAVKPEQPHPHAAGRRAFFTPHAFDGRSCASCHIDGRDDALTWASPAGPLSTPILANRIDNTAPYGWHGESETLSEHISLTFKRLRAEPPEPATLAALADYIRAMPDHRTRPDELSAQELRGQQLFRSSVTACSSCHRGSALTDGTRRQVGDEIAFDTPSLRQLSGSAPYWHDGRFTSLRMLLTVTDGHMGHTQHLGEADISDLIAYLLTM